MVMETTLQKMLPGVFSPVFHELVEVFFHILKDKVEVVVLPDDFSQLHHVRVAQFLKRLRDGGDTNNLLIRIKWTRCQEVGFPITI